MPANSKYDIIIFIKNTVLDMVLWFSECSDLDQSVCKETNTSCSGPQRSSGSPLINLWIDFSLSEW